MQSLHLHAANCEFQQLKTLLNIGLSWRDLRDSGYVVDLVFLLSLKEKDGRYRP